MADERVYIDIWCPGIDHGPVLEPVELYALGENVKLKINPCLSGEDKNKHDFQYDLGEGRVISHEESVAVQRYYDEPATLPRLTSVTVYTKLAPWVCVVRPSAPERGVTCGDLCRALKACFDKSISVEESSALPPRVMASINRTMQSGGYNSYGYTQAHGNNVVMKRLYWLMNRTVCSWMTVDDKYAEKRFGFRAPNLFLMDFSE